MSARGRVLKASATGLLLLLLGLSASPAHASHIAVRTKTFACPAGAVGFHYYDAVPFTEAINCVSEYGIASGYPDGWYHPELGVTRRQMAQFIYRMAREAGVELDTRTQPPFVDDTGLAGEARDAVWGLVNAGVLRGTTPTTFDPNRIITRAQMATFLAQFARFLGVPGFEPGDTDFFDDDDGNPHEANINAVASEGVTAGRGGDRAYDPTGLVFRDQMAEFLARELDILVERGLVPVIAHPPAPGLVVADPTALPNAIDVTIEDLAADETVELFYAPDDPSGAPADFATDPDRFTAVGRYDVYDDKVDNLVARGTQIVIPVQPSLDGDRDFSIAAVRHTPGFRYSAPAQVHGVTVRAGTRPPTPSLSVDRINPYEVEVTVGGRVPGAWLSIYFAEEGSDGRSPDYATDPGAFTRVSQQDYNTPYSETRQVRIWLGRSAQAREFSVAAVQTLHQIPSLPAEIDDIAVPDSQAPVAVDTRIGSNAGDPATLDVGDTFVVAFDQVMAEPSSWSTIEVTDADGTVVQVKPAETAARNMALNDVPVTIGDVTYEPGRVLTVTRTDADAVSGGAPGVAVGATITLAHYADVDGNPWNVYAGDRVIDDEAPAA